MGEHFSHKKEVKDMTATKIFIIALVATIGLIVVFQVLDSGVLFNGEQEDVSTLVDDGSNSSSINVTIQGEVTRTGTYMMNEGSTLYDLIQVASGTTSNADELAYDTSYVLKDGYTFYIAPKYDMNDVCSMTPISKVSINNASSDQLQTVSGIGATVANAIVSYRTANGNFGRIEDIKNVNGVGNATFEKIKNYITLRVS